MDNILNRISLIIENEGIKIGFLEKKIGASKGVLSRAVQNGTDIQSKWIQSIVENYPNYNAEWLLTGRGAMLKSDTYNNVSEKTLVKSAETTPIRLDFAVLERENELLKELLREKEAEVGKLNREIGGLNREIGELREQLRGTKKSPRVYSVHPAPANMVAEPHG